MNTKKTKNKQKHKPPTPQPKPDVAEAAEEKPDQAQQVEDQFKPETIKSEERVPEIVSENVQPALETKPETEEPKKPKRNRNKKKKSDRGGEPEENVNDFNLNVSEKTIESQENNNDNVTEGKTLATPEVTPVERKKKNKNKKRTDQTEKQTEQEVQISPFRIGEEVTDLKIITVVPVGTEASEESKSKKKKNKKKRNDSERSEKAEEVLLCTAAFQKLLENKDDSKDQEKEIKLEVSRVPEETSSAKDQESLSVKTKSEKIVPQPVSRDKSSVNKNESKDEGGKGKKKNKRDKKHAAKDESEDEAFKPLQTKIEIDSEGQSVTVPADIKISDKNVVQKTTEPSQIDTKRPVEEKTLSEKEISPKPKAKIAKPVEKKHKERQATSSTENLAKNEPKCVQPAETPKTVKEGFSENVKLDTKLASDLRVENTAPVEKQKINKSADVILSKEEQIKHESIISETMVPEVKQETTEKSCEKVCETDRIQSPEIGTSKKRRKSPKPKSPQPALIPSDIYKPEDKASLPQETKVQKRTTETQPQKMEPPKLTEPAPPLSLEVISPQVATYTNILKMPDIIMEQKTSKEIQETAALKKEIPTEELPGKESMQVPEAHMGKKRKKSPKPQRKSDKMTEATEHLSSADELKSSPEDVKSDELKTNVSTASVEPKMEIPQAQPRTDSLPDLPPLEDIEIRSVKADESEGSACDITPDIHYPRASSQLLDNNNNTSIQDVTNTDMKLNITAVSDTSLSHGSIETPIPPADRSHPGITITEIATSASGESAPTERAAEKTDLKSKVLDVNVGMEELRRSIERSLAELSSMEKSEKEAEEQFFKAQAKLEHISQMASKKSEEKKQDKPKEISKPQVQDDSKKLVKEQKLEETINQPIPRQPSPAVEEKQVDITISETPAQPLVQENIAKEESKDTKKPTEEQKLVPKSQETISQPIQRQPSPGVEQKQADVSEIPAVQTPPVPARNNNKGKNKKKKGKQESEITSPVTTATTPSSTGVSSSSDTTKESTQDHKKKENSEQKTDKSTQEKGKQQSATLEDNDVMNATSDSASMDFEPIKSFEDALYSSVDENEQDLNKTFEMIANEATKCDESLNPEINITAPIDDDDSATNGNNGNKNQEKVHPVSQPKNLLGHPDIPARLNKTDYKKEKNKHQTPNTKQATVNIKDAVPIEVTKESKESQTENKRRFLKEKTVTESITSLTSENEEYIYKYSFRKVFLPNACHVCKKDLKAIRVPCNFCNLIFYCSLKHKDEDYTLHQGLCFAVSSIVHLRDQKHIYADAKNITGHEYRLLRMQLIVACEKVLKRRLVPWEQEALLYSRICADASCREWSQNKLADCEGCGQISYCSDNPTHLPRSHQRWCKSYSLYNKLVVYQQTRGRLEPNLPTRVMPDLYQIPGKLNEVLASMYEEKIDMTDTQYATLTQIATAPLTAAYCHQLYNNKMNTIYANGAIKKSSFTVHVVGAELQFEADALNKWELFFLHLRPDVKDLRVVLVGQDLNPSKLPLDLLAKIKLCENCYQNKRRVLFDFQDKKTYSEYWSTDFCTPDLVCAFNPSIQRSSVFNGKDTWPSTIKCILKLKVPFIITSYTMSELQSDLIRIKECSEVEVQTISDADFNPFASVRPDRNFISDDEMPLLFKNYCFASVCGAF